MKYKVLSGTPTFEKMMKLRAKIKEVNGAARKIVVEFGGEQWAKSNRIYVLWGGISGIELDIKPKNWALAFPKSHDNVYFPQRNLSVNKELIARIEALPVITSQEFNEIVGYTEQDIVSNGKTTWSFAPGFNFVNDNYIISILDEADFEPNADIVPIGHKEYIQLTSSKARH